jgi:hypothetical protein
MESKVYFISLSNEGDLLEILDENMWRATFIFADASIFSSKKEAEEYIFDMSIRSIWPDVRVGSISI